MKKFFPKITGQLGYQERCHQQLIDTEELYVPFDANVGMIQHKSEIIKKGILYDVKKNPKEFKGIDLNQYIKNSILTDRDLYQECKLPLLKADHDPYKDIQPRKFLKLPGYGQSP